MTAVSVIMPFWNAGQYVGAALRSIARQDIPVAEIIVVDQGAHDPAQVFPDALRNTNSLKFLQIDRTDPGAARNKALEVATGDVVAFLDADDLWPVGKLARQLPRLLERDTAMVSGFTRYFSDVTEEDDLEPTAQQSVKLLMSNLGACLYRREALDRLGYFDPEFRFAEDVDLLLRVCESGMRVLTLPTVELCYRQHQASMMHAPDPRREADFALAARKSLVRRRKGGAVLPLKMLAQFMER